MCGIRDEAWDATAKSESEDFIVCPLTSSWQQGRSRKSAFTATSCRTRSTSVARILTIAAAQVPDRTWNTVRIPAQAGIQATQVGATALSPPLSRERRDDARGYRP